MATVQDASHSDERPEVLSPLSLLRTEANLLYPITPTAPSLSLLHLLMDAHFAFAADASDRKNRKEEVPNFENPSRVRTPPLPNTQEKKPRVGRHRHGILRSAGQPRIIETAKSMDRSASDGVRDSHGF